MATIWKELKKSLAGEARNLYSEIVFNRLFSEWMTLYEFKGVSRDWSEYFFKTLWLSGQICAFKADIPGEPVLWFAPYAPVDYGPNDAAVTVNVVPIRGIPGYPKGARRVLDEDHPDGDVVILKALPSWRPVSQVFAFYANKIGEIQAKIDQNAQQVVLPTGVPTETSKSNQLAELEKAIGENRAFFAIHNDNPALFQVTPMQGNYFIDKLIQYRKDFENEAKNQLGIDSSGEEKRERLLLDEVNANNAEIGLLQDVIKTRLDAFAEDVKKLGFDITFEPRMEKPSANMEGMEAMLGQGNPAIEKEENDGNAR